MMGSIFEEIQIFDDAMDDMDIIRTIIKIEDREKAFYIADIGNVIRRHEEWISKMPRVIPHFGTCITFFAFILAKIYLKKLIYY